MGEELIDVVIDDHLIEADGFPAERADGLGLEEVETLLAEGVVHGADDDGFVGVSIELVETDVTLPEGFVEPLTDIVHTNNYQI